jgi:Fic family protein
MFRVKNENVQLAPRPAQKPAGQAFGVETRGGTMKTREALTEADRLRDEIESVRPIGAEQEARVLQKFRLEWNYHSNAIEGNSLTYGETKAFIMHGLTAKGKPFKDYLDIRGHDQVIDVLADIVRRREELTESAIRELHKILLVEPYQSDAITPAGISTTRRIEIGTYKTTPNHVQTSTGQTHFFANPEETPARMADLVHWYREERDRVDLHPIILAATFHHQFVSIHPFDDGNGRMARILMNLILMQSGYLPVVLKLDRKSEYFLALEKADVGEIEDFVIFVAQALIESENIYLRAARGESIDELGDFDKRLHLLRRAIETESGSDVDQRTQETQNFIVGGMVSSLFEAVGERFAHIDPLFAVRELRILYNAGGQNGVLQNKPIRQLVEQLALETPDKQLSSLQLFYNARGFVKNPTEDFLFNMTIYFGPKDFAINLQITGTQQHELFRADYSTFPGEAEGQQVARTAISDLITSFEKMASKKAV